MSKLSLYDYPKIYDQVRTPDQETFGCIFNLVCDYLGKTPGSVMDPACGPATWLSPFAQAGVMVAGNDICPEMIATAREKCGGRSLEFLTGDMCDLRFTKGPFEVTFELSGTCGLLSNEDNFRCFLDSILVHTAFDGLILLTVFFHESQNYTHFPWVVGEWGPFTVQPEGNAWLRYEVIASEPLLNIDRVRRTVRTDGVAECSHPLIDEYDMFSWKEDHFWSFLSNFPQLELMTAFRYDEPTGIVPCRKGTFCGETTVVFRKIG